ncbi:MAG: (d)CMP kinase [Spirochaetia bacterium]|nr:(d)CMP kinase [Spirochaetia bacterium]
MVIAIDGPAGVGKSSIAKKIAENMGIFYLNSGNFYRAITLYLLKQNVDIKDEKAVIEAASKCDITVKDHHVYLNGADVEDKLHSDAVDAIVAPVSAIVEVRHIVNRQLRALASHLDLISEGRDVTTVVFPDAEYKFYFDADARTRAQRRYKQGTSNMSLEEIEKSIIERDKIDRNKAFGALKIAKDSIYIDTTGLTIDQVYAKVSDSIK